MIVHPSAKWDRKRSWTEFFLEVLITMVLIIICGPLFLLFLCLFPLATVPEFKRESYFSDD